MDSLDKSGKEDDHSLCNDLGMDRNDEISEFSLSQHRRSLSTESTGVLGEYHNDLTNDKNVSSIHYKI